MAKLFINQAKQYADARPTYPSELFQFIASKTPYHDLAWDVGTGNGQAISPLANIFKNVIGTDTSPKQLELAPKLPNVNYYITPPTMSADELQQTVPIAQSSLDLVTVAQAMHWFDLPKFYDSVKWALKKPNGLIAAWCYTNMSVNDEVDAVFGPFYEASGPYWEEARKLVEDKYRSIYFPFGPVDGLDHTGPFEFVAEKVMTMEDYLTYIRSWSAYNTAKDKGVELLTEKVVKKFRVAWNSSGGEKVAKFPIHLRIGKVGDSN